MIRGRLFGTTVMAGLLAVSLTGCGGDVPGPLGALANRDTPADHVADAIGDAADEINDAGVVTSEENLDDEIEEEDEYWIADGEDDDGDGDRFSHIIVFKNTSSKTVEVSSNSELSYSDEGIVGVGESSVEGIGPNCTGVLCEEIEDEHTGDGEPSLDSTLSAVEDDYNTAVQNLSSEVSVKGGKAFVKIANNDTSNPDEVTVFVLFFNGSKAVAYEEDDYSFSLGSLKSGKSITRAYEPETDVHFDSVKVYVNGCMNKY